MKRPQLFLLILIILLAFFFRTYQVVERFEFAHDADLYSWMVKDIVINGHLRLVGQETSAPGIFIGPLFYYLLAPFYLFFNMDPVGSIVPTIIIGLLTILSYFFVFSKLFNWQTGLIGAFLYAVLLSTVSHDRWVVPTVTTSIWSVWFFYTVIMIARGKLFVFPLLGILVGLIWNIHIALIPALIAIPIALLNSKKIPNFKQLVIFFMALIITSLPLIFFELRHNFQQIISLGQNFTLTREGATGWYKFQIVLDMIAGNLNNLLFAPHAFDKHKNILLPLILISAFWLTKKKLWNTSELIPLYSWILAMILFFSISSSPVSEYYFNNLEVIFLSIVSLSLYFIFKSSRWGKKLVLGLLIIVSLKNAYLFLTLDTYHKGYIERKAVVSYIVEHAKEKNFPCFSINYITSPGENVGFRYFFFLKNAHIAVPGRGSPVYSIVIPDEYSKEVSVKFGHIGIIPPKEIPSKDLMIDACSGQNTNLTDPMFGYVE